MSESERMTKKWPRLILPAAFHVLPVVPVVLGRPLTGVALALLVAVAYIKVEKLAAMARELDEAARTSPPAAKERSSILAARRRWAALTFRNA